MATTIVFEEQFEIPADIASLGDFRRWALSDAFPQQGRIDYVTGRIEVDMSPEDLYTHQALKTELIGVLHRRIKALGSADIFSDRTRISSAAGDVSAEPDIVVLLHSTLAAGNVRLVPKAGDANRYVELEGAPDLVVEIVSDSSVGKDQLRLPPAYFTSGVNEFWLVDARGEEFVFKIHRRGTNRFEPVDCDQDGFQSSTVLGQDYRLDRQRDARDLWRFDLTVR